MTTTKTFSKTLSKNLTWKHRSCKNYCHQKTSLLIFTQNYVERGIITEKQLQHLEKRVEKIKITYNKRILINTDVAN